MHAVVSSEEGCKEEGRQNDALRKHKNGGKGRTKGAWGDALIFGTESSGSRRRNQRNESQPGEV